MPSFFVEIPADAAAQWPPSCACCGQPAEFAQVKGLRLPLCPTCKAHLGIPFRRLPFMILGTVAWMILVLSLFGGGPVGAVLGLGGLYGLLWWSLSHRQRNPGCTSKISSPVFSAMAFKGERTWMFTSEPYARAFAAANGSTRIWKQGEKKPV